MIKHPKQDLSKSKNGVLDFPTTWPTTLAILFVLQFSITKNYKLECRKQKKVNMQSNETKQKKYFYRNRYSTIHISFSILSHLISWKIYFLFPLIFVRIFNVSILWNVMTKSCSSHVPFNSFQILHERKLKQNVYLNFIDF